MTREKKEVRRKLICAISYLNHFYGFRVEHESTTLLARLLNPVFQERKQA